MGLNLNLSSQLMLHALFLDLRLEHHLQHHDGFQRLLPRKVDIPVLALTQRFTNFKVLQSPFPDQKDAQTETLEIR